MLPYDIVYTALILLDFNAGIGLVQMMGMTNYLALVGGGKSPKFAMNKVNILVVSVMDPLANISRP